MEPKAVSEQLISAEASSLSPQAEVEPEKASRSTLKRLRGGFLLILGYLLSPLCWWNDLIFNLPLAYGFGYICRWFSASWFIPGLIVGYWLSNIIGILLMQFGAIDVIQTPSQPRNLKKDLITGVASSTVYTLVIVALVHFKILDASVLSDENLRHFSSTLPLMLGQE